MAPTRPPKPPKTKAPEPVETTSAKPRKPAPKRANIVKSGNAGSNKPDSKPLAPGEVAPPPPLFPAGYKTPLSLLTERCQKSGWDRPSVDPKRLPSGKWTAAVTLRRKNPKSKTGESETVYMRPPPSPSPISVEFDSAMEAKHYAAVFAMFRFSHNLRLNMQLPPAPRDYWAALEKEKAASTPNKAWLWSLTPFETAAAAQPPPSAVPLPPALVPTTSRGPTVTASPFASASSSRAPTPSSTRSAGNGPTPRSQAPTSLPKYWLEAPEVRMPTHLRDLVEETIRASMSQAPQTHGMDSDDLVDDFADGMTLARAAPTAEEQACAAELVTDGWRPGHVSAALSYVSHARRTHHDASDTLQRSLARLPIRQAFLSHLHLHVPEEDLPSHLRGAKPADATARIATAHGVDALGRLWKAERMAKDTGVPVAACEAALAVESVNGEEGRAVEVLGRRLVGWVDGGEENVLQELREEALLRFWDGGALSKHETSELKARREDELVGLEGMFGERFRRIEDGCEILASSMKAGKGDQVILRVLLHEGSRYPTPQEDDTATMHLPTFYVYSSTLPPYLRLHLTALLHRQFVEKEHSDDWLDLVRAGYGGVIGEMATFLSDRWQREIEHPPDSRGVLRWLMGSRLLPVLDATNGNNDVKKARVAQTARRGPSKTNGSQAQHAALMEYWGRVTQRPGYAEMLRTRMKLPAWSMRERIVDLIHKHRVVIVSGETGSGKTTQVPRFVLEDAILRGHGASTNIVVTQPRRVSAIGVASRVGAEMLEDINDANSRQLVGYAIRGERRASRDARVLFCTTGVVLSRLSRGGDPNLDDVSHIFIDEVHERSVDSDFLLLELRDILTRNKKIKVVLMSATINQAQFSDYFGGAPCIEIPGFTHPVQDHYLEDILPHLPNFSATGKPARKASQEQLDRMRASFMSRGVHDERTLMTLETLTRSEKLDFGLVGATVAYCLARSREVGGDVLVFMTGVFEIKQAVDAIRSAVSSHEHIEVMPLHANLTSQEQTSVFKPVKGRKVVVATNVAETSITIDGIVYVIDCGRVKENQFDPETSITRLVETWTSKASSRQRRGRAGRTRPGECYKLFSHYTEDNVMANHAMPEIKRIPLESLCLQIKATNEHADVKTYLAKALDPPDVRAIDSAWATLKLLGAVEEGGSTNARLTPLGMHLAMIPVDLRLGKMLVLSAIFRCLDPILTVVALLSSKPFFLNPMDKRDEAKKARSMYYTGRSDLLSDCKAFDACLAARQNGNAALRQFAENNFISLSTFRDVVQLRHEYLNALSDVGFIPFRASASSATFNENAANEHLLKAIIFAGTGRLVKVKLPPATFDKGSSGAIERDRESREVKFFEKDGRVFLHPGSLLFTETRFATPFITYFSKHVTTKPFLRDATEVPLYGVLLFGGKVHVELEGGVTVGSDGWVVMRAWPRIGVLVNSLRQLLDVDLESNIEEPNFEGQASPVVQAMLALLEKDGGLY